MSGLLAFLVFATAAYGAGELDPTFDGDGRVLTDFGGEEGAADVAVQVDGKIVAVGSTSNSSTEPFDFSVARYNADGTLDPTFSGDGKVVTDFGSSDFALGVAIQADGKAVVAGFTGDRNFALARYRTNGSLDPTFGDDGKVTTNFVGRDGAADVAIQPDGKIVAVGVGNTDFQCCGSFALARYNPDGSLDASFDGDGRVLTNFGVSTQSLDRALAVAVQADGKIVAAGDSNAARVDPQDPRDFALARYNADGSLDTSFDGDGKQTTHFNGDDRATDVSLQPDGKIVAVGESGDRGESSPGAFALARYGPDGSLDPTFGGGDGKVRTTFGSDVQGATAVAIQANGKIVTAGRAFDSVTSVGDFALARYNPNGSLDSTFDFDGRLVTDFGADEAASGLAIQRDGKIVAAGGTGADAQFTDFALARYLPGGRPQISINDMARLEGNAGLTRFVFKVSLSAPSSQTVTVSYRTADGSATGVDYTGVAPTTITFSPGETTKTVTVDVSGEVAIEPDETFFVQLSNAVNATIAVGTGVGTITNDDLSDSVPCTVTGTDGNDVLTGTSGNDVICGGRGDDQINGLDGADVLKGEGGNDLLVGGNGVDLLVGGMGADDLRGELGNDTLRGGGNDDTLDGSANSDALFGDSGSDSLNAQDGVSANDSADGGGGNDSCVFDPSDFVTSCP